MCVKGKRREKKSVQIRVKHTRMSKREGNNRDEAMLLKYVHAGIPDVVHVVCVQINGRRADKLRGREKGFLKCRLVVCGVSLCVWRKVKKRKKEKCPVWFYVI